MRYALLGAFGAVLVPGTTMAFNFQTDMVEMRDGTHLATDVFTPSQEGRFGTILIRTTYGRDMIPDEAASEICDGLNFALVVQDTRGRYDSEGVDDVFLSDGWGDNQDGYDTVDWIVEQNWSDGGVGIFGASALGITAYLATGSLHPAIKAIHVGISPWVFYDVAYQSGCFRDGLVVDWLEGQDSGYMLELYYDHPLYDELWASLDMRTRAALIDVPAYHWGGWYDIFTEGPLSAFVDLTSSGHNSEQRLVMGPWTHLDDGAISPVQGELRYPNNSVIPLAEVNPLGFFQKYVQGNVRPGMNARQPVLFYMMGDVDNSKSTANDWFETSSWPVPSTPRAYYLTASGALSTSAPTTTAAPRSFTYDPSDPSPSIGGAELSLPAGPRDQNALLQRADTLSYETAALTRAVTVVGMVKVVLNVSSSSPDTDYTVRLVDVYPDGRGMLVNDGIAKLRYHNGVLQESFVTPGDIVSIEVALGSTAIRFEPGHRIRILVSSSNYRRFDASKNNDDELFGAEPAQIAVNSVYSDKLHVSQLILPEPLRGSYQTALDLKQAPTSKAISLARQRLHKGATLSRGDVEALQYDGGQRLLEAVFSASER